jgi:hypothetical protein
MAAVVRMTAPGIESHSKTYTYVVSSCIAPTIGFVVGEQTAPRLAAVIFFWNFLSLAASRRDA